ncbi:MAG: hypothetical protein ABW352_19105 [Polyangiales bacterium]
MSALAACAPSSPDGAEPGGAQENDASAALGFFQITVHVAGYRGGGLALTIDGEQQLPVPSDGIWRVKLSAPSADIQLEVVTQPADPEQVCDVSKLSETVFTVTCHEAIWRVSGVVSGLSGKGLQLALHDDEYGELPRSTLAVAVDGTFKFPEPLPDDRNYEVRILAQPTEPRQTCAIENGSGYADVADVTDVQVVCSTQSHVFTSVVTGLKGKGLMIRTSVGTFPIVNDGITTYADNPYPDGFRYDIEVAGQPSQPDQVCSITGGKGIIDGEDVTYYIVCDAAGNLRISEVGACPFSSSSCWFEVYNVGEVAESLSFYRMRAPAISPSAYVPSRIFALPPIVVPPRSAVVLQGRTSDAIANGSGVYHIGDGDIVPWWTSDGFLELLNPAGATASFVRFGANTVAPSTGGTWTGGAAPALPRGTDAYGASIQQRTLSEAISGPSQWASTVFATYGALNDNFSDTDADHDGIPDKAELPGATFGGLDLYAMGARQDRRDVFVEIDYMGGTDPVTVPRREALQKVVDAFSRRNIALHFDVGDLFSDGFDPAAFNLGGGNMVPFATALALAPQEMGITRLYDIKAANMAANRRMVFHYQLFAYSQQKDGSGGSTGFGELPGNDSAVTLGGFGLQAGDATQRNVLASYQAASLMHELGHNLGLRHGGGDQINRKPNYLSVMNYLYSPFGLATIGNAEGDRYGLYTRCAPSAIGQLTNPPSGEVGRFLIDFSNGSGRNLDEAQLFEVNGLGRAGSVAVDYNCNARIDGSSYARDLNSDGALDVLADYDDWGALDVVFRRTLSGAENGPALQFLRAVDHDDILTGDTVHQTDEACPPLP